MPEDTQVVQGQFLSLWGTWAGGSHLLDKECLLSCPAMLIGGIYLKENKVKGL